MMATENKVNIRQILTKSATMSLTALCHVLEEFFLSSKICMFQKYIRNKKPENVLLKTLSVETKYSKESEKADWYLQRLV
jgi:hypothetical protein